jgi:hypothetical protein
MRYTLHVLGHVRCAVQGLPPLDLVDHLSHIHFDFAAILAGAVEASYSPKMLVLSSEVIIRGTI